MKTRWWTLLLVVALCAPVALADSDEERPFTAVLAEATKAARPYLEAALREEQGSSAAKKAVKAGIDLLRPHAKTVREVYSESGKGRSDQHWFYADVFNQLLTLAKYHKSRIRESYIGYWAWSGKGNMQLLVPVRRGWTIKYHDDKDQHCSSISQRDPNKDLIALVQVHRYKWNTTYSGVGGENARKLAEGIHESDRESAREDGDRCTGLKTKRFNKHFTRSHYYRVKYKDPKVGFAFYRDEYYVKGTWSTFNIVVLTYRTKAQDKSPFEKWRAEEHPELEWLLSTMDSREG